MPLPAQFDKQPWRRQAACRGLDVNMWFPDGRGNGQLTYNESRPICDSCPVKQPCLEYALSEVIEIGMWGGTTPDERKAIGFARAGVCEICRGRYPAKSSRQRFCSDDCRREGRSRVTSST